MSREIYTYTDLKKLPKNPDISSLKGLPWVTVSADMKYRMRESPLFRGSFLWVSDFYDILHGIDENWDGDQQKFNQMAILSEFLRGKLAQAQDNPQKTNWLTGYLRNLSPLHLAITLLEQAQMEPEDLDTAEDRNLKLMVEAWQELLRRDPDFRVSREKINRLTTSAAWEPILHRVFPLMGDHAFSAIVFHGFYYFTPIQEHLLRLLEQAGYQLIFLIPYDERYPFVYEAWDVTYAERYGYPLKSQWHMEKSDEADPYGEIFEGRPAKIQNHVEIKEYASIMEFVDAVPDIQNKGYTLYSPDSQGANEILKDYFPESYGDRRLLAYPIGQFVGNLNQMWDAGEQGVILEEDCLVECFSSGWLTKDGVAARAYLGDLMNILPFFEGCRTPEKWRSRIALLREIRSNAVDTFEPGRDPNPEIARWQRAAASPLNQFSPFAVPAERLEIILALIQQLLEMAEGLFCQRKSVTLWEHIQQLDAVLKANELSGELYEEERELVRDLFEALSQPSQVDIRYSPADAANALRLYLSGHFDNDEIQQKWASLVKHLYAADAACIGEQDKVHICLCDSSRMPGKQMQYVWPLSDRAIRSSWRKTRNPLIENYILLMESRTMLIRYFLYSALKSKSVQLSWVSRMEEKPLSPSSYLQLLSSAAEIPVTPSAQKAITFDLVAKTAEGEEKLLPYKKEHMPRSTLKEAKMDYALCPMRYLFGYVLEEFPSYQSRFQQNFALKSLISAVYELAQENGHTLEETYHQVTALFPYLRRVEKRSVYDILHPAEENPTGGSRVPTEFTHCGSYQYTDQRLDIHYLNAADSKTARQMFGELYTPEGRDGMAIGESKCSCSFCPHMEYCPAAKYPID